MRFPKKRGAIEIQFNWVFVLIAGALILVFFINISNIQRKNADQNLAFDLLSQVDLIMSGALSIPKTGQVFDMPNIPFNLECSRISTLGVSRQFPDRILFGPLTLKGRRLIVWSQDWTVPYKVSNFLYITTSDIRYIVVAKQSDFNYHYAQIFNASLPENITKEIADISSSGFQDKGSFAIRLIFLFETDNLEGVDGYSRLRNIQLADSIKNMADDSVSGVYINQNSGIVRFIKKTGTSLDFEGNDFIPVLKEPMIFGAVFAGSSDEFNCSVAKAFRKLHFVSGIYEARENALMDAYSHSSFEECKADETRDVADIGIIKEKALTPDEASIALIKNSEGNIQTNNNNALRSSCAPIY